MLNYPEYLTALSVVLNITSNDNLCGTDVVDIQHILKNGRIVSHSFSEGDSFHLETITRESINKSESSGISLKDVQTIVQVITTSVGLGDRFSIVNTILENYLNNFHPIIICGLFMDRLRDDEHVRVDLIGISDSL